MGYSHGGYGTRLRFGGRLTRSVRALIIANVVVFIIQILFYVAAPKGEPAGENAFDHLTRFEKVFALTPSVAIEQLRLWQFITYSFLHDVTDPWHIIFNLLMLWFLGGDVEQGLGRRRFLQLYFAAAFAGGVCMIPWYTTPSLGASGAVFGVMAMYARLFPDRVVLLFGIVPMRARTLVLGLVALEVVLLVFGGSNIAHLAHLGGFAVGWCFPGPGAWYDDVVRRWTLRRKWRREREDGEVRRRVDELLAKVAGRGPGSLSRSERRFLARASRRYRR